VLRRPAAAFIDPLGEAVEPQDNSPHGTWSYLSLRLTLSPACLDTFRTVFGAVYSAVYSTSFSVVFCAIFGAVYGNVFGTIFCAAHGGIFSVDFGAVHYAVYCALFFRWNSSNCAIRHLHTSRLHRTDAGDGGGHVWEVAIVDNTSVALVGDRDPVRAARYILS
jgi:hypothetical protein